MFVADIGVVLDGVSDASKTFEHVSIKNLDRAGSPVSEVHSMVEPRDELNATVVRIRQTTEVEGAKVRNTVVRPHLFDAVEEQ